MSGLLNADDYTILAARKTNKTDLAGCAFIFHTCKKNIFHTFKKTGFS